MPSRPATALSDPRFARELDDRGCEALLVLAESSRDPDLAAFVGNAHLGRSLLVAPRQGTPRLAFWSPMEREEAAGTGFRLLDAAALDLPRLSREAPDAVSRWVGVLSAALEQAGLSPARVALAGHPAAGELHGALRALERRGWWFVDGHELVRRLRKRKGPEDLEEIRRAADGTRAAFFRVASLLAAARPAARGLELEGTPLTVGRLRSEVARILAQFGLEQPEGNLLAPGEEGGVPHNKGTSERRLQAGESLIVDLFPRGALFADCTRTFCVGEPPAMLLAAHRAVREALEEAYRRTRTGIRAWSVQEAVCGLFARRGYPNPVTHPGTVVGYVHNLGHGVGRELHEFPSFSESAGAEGVLEAGDVLTLEPGLYDPEAGWGVRLEDLVHLTPKGPKNLTPLPYTLDPREWMSESARAG